LSRPTHRDRVTAHVREALTAAGFYEAITMSFVSQESTQLFQPRGEQQCLHVEHSSRRHENVLRQSLVPSLLVSRRENERHGTFDAQLFEVARVYLKAAPGQPERDVEPTMVSLVSGRPFGELKGIHESLAQRLNSRSSTSVEPEDLPQFVPGRGARVLLNGNPWGWLGELDRSVTDHLSLRDAVTVAELDLSVLEDTAALVPAFALLPQFPAADRDLNFVLDEHIRWSELEAVVRASAGPNLESVGFGGQYRGQQIGANRKSYLVTLSYRAADRTLTHEEVEQAQAAVIEACGKKLGAALR
jgi:phenylalanyl-tRNA synthetase beta chain